MGDWTLHIVFWQLNGSIALGKPQSWLPFRIILWGQSSGWIFANRKEQNCILHLNLTLCTECWHAAKAEEIPKSICQALFLRGFCFSSLFFSKVQLYSELLQCSFLAFFSVLLRNCLPCENSLPVICHSHLMALKTLLYPNDVTYVDAQWQYNQNQLSQAWEWVSKSKYKGKHIKQTNKQKSLGKAE